jgi:hypothetical protein
MKKSFPRLDLLYHIYKTIIILPDQPGEYSVCSIDFSFCKAMDEDF